jgi:polyisoprenoid-binding protein YceI
VTRPGDPFVTAPRTAPAEPPSDAPAGVSRRWPVIGLALLILALAVAAWMGISYLFLRPAAPAAVGLSSASPAATASAPLATGTATSTDAPAESATPAAPPASDDGSASGGLDGTWSVDESVGSFSDFSGSFVGYRVQEELANIGAATAVGRTPDVTGAVTFAGTTVTAVEMTADLTTLQSDEERRDGQLRRQALETDTYPTATFTLTEPVDLGSVPVDGQVVTATATGDLTLHGVTRSVAIPIEARLSGDVVSVTGSTEILFSEYGISQPQSFVVLSVDDSGVMEFQLHLRKS